MRLGDMLVCTKVKGFFDFEGNGERIALVAYDYVDLGFGKKGIAFKNRKTDTHECILCRAHSCSNSTRVIYQDVFDDTKNYRFVEM